LVLSPLIGLIILLALSTCGASGPRPNGIRRFCRLLQIQNLCVRPCDGILKFGRRWRTPEFDTRTIPGSYRNNWPDKGVSPFPFWPSTIG
jgi:hypothetical protein